MFFILDGIIFVYIYAFFSPFLSLLQVIETSTSPTFNRLLTPNGSLSSNSSNGDSLCLEMSNLMHDYEVISRISDLATTSRGNYPVSGLGSNNRTKCTIIIYVYYYCVKVLTYASFFFPLQYLLSSRVS